MKRFVMPLLLAAAMAGCQPKKPPAELVGKWQYVQDMGILGRAATRLILKDTGRFQITHLVSQPGNPNQLVTPSGPNLTGGEDTPDGELVEGGKWEVADGQIKLIVTKEYVGGVDVGPMQGGTVKAAYSVQGNSLTIDSKALGLQAVSAAPGARPASSGSITLTRLPG